MQFGIIGSGSWATALAKILTDNHQPIHWWIRNEQIISHIRNRHHNPKYLSSVYFNTDLLHLHTDVNDVLSEADAIVMAIPSAYVAETLQMAGKNKFTGKKIISAIKGILPQDNLLL
ncbi:MAG: NAD(P)-binding domain-containing protein, partial [Flavitalea sp.]